MRVVDEFEPIDFLLWILSKINRNQYDVSNNLIHTHDRVWYNPENGYIRVEEVCKNYDGSCFWCGKSGEARIPTEWNILLPENLTKSPYWGDF